MKNNDLSKPSCFCPDLSSRRQFMKTCGACAIGLSGIPVLQSNGSAPSIRTKKLRLLILYALHTEVQDRPDWPNTGFDFRPEIVRFNALVSDVLPGFEIDHATSSGLEQTKSILSDESRSPFDGYIVFQMNCWNQVVQTVAKTGKPVLYVDFQYGGSGGFLVYTAGFLRNKTDNFGFVSSSRTEDLIRAVQCFRIIQKGGTASEFTAAVRKSRIDHTPKSDVLTVEPDNLKTISPEECLFRMKRSRILAVRDEKSRMGDSFMGIPLDWISFSEINESWKAADRDQAKTVAERWITASEAVIDVDEKTLINSAAMYLGMKEVLRKHDANAITINCLGGFYGGHIHAYPCLGFHELNNEGFIGACECDVLSTATMVTFNIMTNGRPGYISDPVIDTGKRQIIYAHCVASNKVFGPEGETNPFIIMNHSEDRQGASVRSIMPLGYMTTSLRMNNDTKEVRFHQAKTVDNDPDDRACRTKICADPVGDIEKLFTMWDKWGWHRVTFYGDLKEEVYSLADEAGWKILEEA